MSENSESLGKTTIAPEVLLTIVRLTALSVPGVSKLSPISGGVNRLFTRGADEGVRILVEKNTVFTDIYVTLCKDVNVRDVSRTIQSKVARAITEMVGLDVGRVNVHIEDIDYESQPAA